MAASAALILRESPSMKKAVSLINEIDIGRFPRLLTRILQKLHLKAENSFSEEEEEKLQAAFSLERQDLHLVLETISFILEQAVYYNVKPAALQQQLENIHLRQDKAEAFVSAWSSMGQETIEKFRQRILAPHKLETVGWQLNLQMAHSAQAKLKSPQAVLQLGVSNEDSKIAEFQTNTFWGTEICQIKPVSPGYSWAIWMHPFQLGELPGTLPRKSLKKVLVEFSHKELFDFYNKLETIQAQLDSLT
ncbi:COMM domain-containing protein 10 isoform X1 [Lagenorhynchus albirostris]|uniref:COMM domain-containing protein 10 isoform X1 n=1 Tax=Lagenorhynchus albirostris TaxID=27610 RepID=UPI0028E53D22|nr:COMM domain-containing protein 10 isoform X1 [Lagenorhynchus albirostris]